MVSLLTAASLLQGQPPPLPTRWRYPRLPSGVNPVCGAYRSLPRYDPLSATIFFAFAHTHSAAGAPPGPERQAFRMLVASRRHLPSTYRSVPDIYRTVPWVDGADDIAAAWFLQAACNAYGACLQFPFFCLTGALGGLGSCAPSFLTT